MRIAFNFNKKVNKEQSWRYEQGWQEHRCKHSRKIEVEFLCSAARRMKGAYSIFIGNRIYFHIRTNGTGIL